MSHTPVPWAWHIEDYSMATLEGPPDEEGRIEREVLSVSPCSSCQDSAEKKDWKWGRCLTPTLDDANFIVRACNCHDKLLGALKIIKDADLAHPFIPSFYREIIEEAIAKAEEKE
jgi:hypothetical protein